MLLSSILIFITNSNWEDKVDKDLLTQFTTQDSNEYLVIFKEKANLDQSKRISGKLEKANFVYNKLKLVSTQSQKDVVYLLSNNNISYKSYIVSNVILVNSDIEILKEIAIKDEVDKIIANPWMKSLNYIEEKISIQSAREAEPEWGIKMINADSLWRLGFTGQNVIIGGQDTGYDWEVSPLRNKYRGINGSDTIHDYNWHDAISEISPLNGDTLITDTTNPCGLKSPFPCDDNNHGTHTMGTMVGKDEDNSIGVAPDAKWIGCRNMERGSGKPSTYLECFEFFLAPTDLNDENPDVTMAPHVINNSWYCSDTEGCNPSNWDFMETAVNNLKASGIVVVVSAGNSGPNCNTISEVPAIFENSFSIGATRSNDTIANFSSRGLVSVDSTYRIKPNVSAPGQNVRSVIRGGNFANFSGTSMAGPHVAGMVALLISARPQLAGEVELIETIIENSAVPKISNQECDGLLPSNIPNPTYGHGRIDVLAAYKNLISSVDDNLSINNKYKIYPNPSTGVVNIISNTAENFEIQVLDKNGKTVINPSFNKDFNNIRLDISKLSSGIYYILLKSNTSLVVEKLVKI